jgi:hypothetical protein
MPAGEIIDFKYDFDWVSYWDLPETLYFVPFWLDALFPFSLLAGTVAIGLAALPHFDPDR